MAINIHNLIAAINPDVFCDPEVKSKVKSLVKEKGYLEAAKEAKPKPSEYMNFDKADIAAPFSFAGIKNPIEQHAIVYDAFGENLEPLYYWILDYVNRWYGKSTKFADNFASSTGSGHFSEMGMKQARMQEEGMKMLGTANQLVKSILNLIYDLKEFELRLQLYDKLKSQKKEESNAAKISLKQIWMDTVDMKRGNTSLKGMAFSQGSQFVTLIDAFMAAEDESLTYKGAELDLNERVKRIVQQKILEFNLWMKESETELKKRYEIEKIYLKSQVNTLKLYAKWAKPYLKAAQQLQQQSPSASAQSALVTAFNASVIELVLMGEGFVPISDMTYSGAVDKIFRKVGKIFTPIIIIEIQFRSMPERTQQGGYGFRGRLEANFTSYALAADEIAVLKEEMDKDDLGDAFRQIEGATEESLAKIQADIDYFLEEKKAEKKEEKKSEDENPFSALFSIFKSEKKEEKNGKKKISQDSEMEKAVRSIVLIEARKSCQKAYEIFKKTHNMPGLPLS